MQRAITSRAATSVRSASKLRPLTAAGFNAQQLRFAHKVRTWRVQSEIPRWDVREVIVNDAGCDRSLNSVLKLELPF